MLALAVSACGRAPSEDTPNGGTPADGSRAEPTQPVGGASMDDPVPTTVTAGESSGGATPADPSGMPSSGESSGGGGAQGGAMPIDPPSGGQSGAMPVDPSTMPSSGEPAGGAMPDDPPGMAGGQPSGGAMPVGEPPEPIPDVPDPVFDAPWFPCPEGDYPEHTVVVKTHDKVVHTYENTRIDAEVELPEGSFKAVALRVVHECPTGGICDLYDRLATIELVNPGETGEETLPLLRYVTTYRFNQGETNYMCSFTDVTPYASLLTGTRTLRSWLDTIVSPGHELGDGWQVSAELVFYPGPAADPVQIEELYGHFINIGEAPGSIDEQTPPATVEIPEDATRVVAQLMVTGHGWGPENTDNCAEFCRLDQTITVNRGTPHVINSFRADCAQNPLARYQQRNPTGSRNGWCPGAVVLPHTVDITDEVTPGMPAEIDFGVQRADGSEYIDADPTGYNPNELVSLQLLMSTAAAP